MSSYLPVGWANDGTHPLSQANMKTLDAGVLSRPAGILAYAQRTTDQASTGATIASVSDIDTGGGRRIKITGYCRVSGSDGGLLRASLRQGTSQLQSGGAHTIDTADNRAVALHLSIVLTPTAGAKSYNFFVNTHELGTGLTVRAGSDRPAFILIEDVGPA